MSCFSDGTNEAKRGSLHLQSHYSDAEWMDHHGLKFSNAGLSSELAFEGWRIGITNDTCSTKDYLDSICQESRVPPMLLYCLVDEICENLDDEQLIAEFKKIRMAVADLKSHKLRRTLKRAGAALEPDTLKKQKSTEAPVPYVPDVPQPPVVSSPKSFGIRRKSLGRSRTTKPKSILTKLDLDATCDIHPGVSSDEDS
ncbi:hypothetical protein Tco_0613166 [Tanacetum coccineum]